MTNLATKIQWTDATWSPITGCTKVSAGCDHCLAPDTRVLRADMTWVAIRDIRIGDRLVSFTETPAIGQNRVWEEAEVLATWEVEKPTIDIELGNGATFTASEDHKWLIAHRGKDKWWRQTVDLNFKTSLRTVRCEPTVTDTPDYRAGYIAGATDGDGTFRWDPDPENDRQVYWRIAKPERDRVVLDRIVGFLASFGIDVSVKPFDGGKNRFTETPLPMAKVETRKNANLALIASLCVERDSREWMAGWMAGMFDTDASYSGGNLRYCQAKPNDVLDKVVRFGKELGFEFGREDFTACPGARLVGGIAENIAFLSAISPALTRRCRDFYGKRVDAVAVPVVGVRRGPVRKLIDITTSTGTFVAEGALTHNCYISTTPPFRIAHRTFDKPGIGGTTGVLLHPERLAAPLHWRKPRRVFVNSLSDLFHEDVPDEYIVEVFAVMALAQAHTFQILTKRHGRMRSMLKAANFEQKVGAAAYRLKGDHGVTGLRSWQWPLPNAWLGVSTEDQRTAELRIPALLETPAAVRFISAEPLLGPIELRHLQARGVRMDAIGGDVSDPQGNEVYTSTPSVLDWIIVGGESGFGSRSMDLDWVRTVVDDCRGLYDTHVFVKQLGSVWAKANSAADRKGGDPDEWPAELRVRQFPRAEIRVGAK